MLAGQLNLSDPGILSDQSLYQKRGTRKKFEEELPADEERAELTREEILKLNKVNRRYSRREIEEFLEEREKDGMIDTAEIKIETKDEFEKLILAYDYAMKKNSLYQAVEKEEKRIHNGPFSYPNLLFIKK